MMSDEEDEDYEVDHMINIFNRIGMNNMIITRDQVVELLKPYKTVNWYVVLTI